MARLGDVATYINGYAFKPEDWSQTGVPIIRIQDLTGNSYQANRYNGEYEQKYEVNDGDVLISWSASLGVYVWHGEKAVLNQHIFKVVFDKVEVSKSFFVHQVENILERASSSTHGATMKHLTKPVFDALPFFLPPLTEQCKIAAVLDKISELIAKRHSQLNKLDALVKSRFVEMFGLPDKNPYGWYQSVLGDYVKVVGGYAFKSSGFLDSGIPVLRIGNINTGHFSCTNMVYWQEDPALERYKVYPNDLVMSLTGTVDKDDYGNVCMLGDEYPMYYLNQRNAKLEIQKFLDKCYLSELLKFPYMKKQLTKVSRGVRQANISNNDMLNLCITVPPIALQEQFAIFIGTVEELKSKIINSLVTLETLKKSLIQEYFLMR